jgi:lysozyme
MNKNIPETVSQAGLDIITAPGNDSLELDPYLCPANELTVGYGHVLLPKDARYYVDLEVSRLGALIQECKRLRRVSPQVKSRLRCTPAMANNWLKLDTDIAGQAVRNMIHVDLNQNQFDALVSFVFNFGQGKFATSTLRKLINIGRYDLAAKQFGRWRFAKHKGKDVVMPGLVRRRAEERKLFETPVKP